MQRPNMALTKNLDKSNWSLIFERPKNVKEERRRGEEEERKRKRRRREEKEKGREKKYGTMTMSMELCIVLYGYMFVGCEL